ncbi:MAG: hypothetical protein H7Y42_12160 [Chitinophagaceae bacterium]|nr:hypothetical protein [Chitinophagaceae bacterium]
MSDVGHLTPGDEETSIPLQPLVGILNQALLPFLQAKKSFIINEVSPNLEMSTPAESILPVLNGMLAAVVMYSDESCIRISTEVVAPNILQLNVTDNNSCHTYGVACALQNVLPVAEKMGGKIIISNHRQRITTVSFRFIVPHISPQVGDNLRGAA